MGADTHCGLKDTSPSMKMDLCMLGIMVSQVGLKKMYLLGNTPNWQRARVRNDGIQVIQRYGA